MAAPISPIAPAPAPLGALLGFGRPLVMGILNVTPDSFSDGGDFREATAAIAQARRMISEGADILDIGAESTRPYTGATPVSADEEQLRLEPVLEQVVSLGIPVSIDTMKAKVADWALRQGATIANDVWGLQRDPEMAAVIATHGCPVIVMHNRETVEPAIDIVADMIHFFERSLGIADRAGVRRDAVVLDPGIGFGKTPAQSMAAIARLDALAVFGLPILIGASRKRFIDSVVPTKPKERVPGSLAAHLLAVQNGAIIVRAHDVGETVQALRVASAIQGAS